MDQFPGNSRRPERAREDAPKKQVERVIQGEVTRRKTPLGRRFTQHIIGGDAQSVWGHVIGNVLVPYARDMISDAATTFIDSMIFGDSGGGRGRSRGRSIGGRTDYQSPFGRSRGSSRYDEPKRELSRRARSTHDFDEILVDLRVDAEEVLDRLEAMLDKYDSVTVADFYELCGVDASYTDQKYGWTSLAGATINRVRGKWAMRMPAPEPLD